VERCGAWHAQFQSLAGALKPLRRFREARGCRLDSRLQTRQWGQTGKKKAKAKQEKGPHGIH